MTLVSDIIFSAYRDANNVSINAALSPAEQSQGLQRLRSLVASVFGNEAGENLRDWPLGNYGRSSEAQFDPNARWVNRPQKNARLIATAEEARTVYLPDCPDDGTRIGVVDPYARLATYPITLSGNGRTIEGAASVVLNTNSTNRVWFYRADTGNWARITDIESFSEMPFPLEFDDYFIIALAGRINPTCGRATAPESIARFNQQRNQLLARYVQNQPLDILDDVSWPFMSVQSYDQQREFSSNRAFNRGSYPWG